MRCIANVSMALITKLDNKLEVCGSEMERDDDVCEEQVRFT